MIYNNIKLDLDYTEDDLRRKLRRLTGRGQPSYRLVRRSVDARDKKRVRFVISVDTEPEPPEYTPPEPAGIHRFQPVIVGSGPAGLFCALTLARMGLSPIILERGKDVDRRKADVQDFWKHGRFSGNSNTLFGEGGAGTFSDGKLNTGINEPLIRYVMRVFAESGAPPDILYEAKPHIGTDLLAGVLKNLRRRVINAGGEYRFEHRLADIETDGAKAAVIHVVTPNTQYSARVGAICLAIGHSARDTYAMLHNRGVNMTRKPFSVGARIEHPQTMIDAAQYGSFAGHPKLGRADYKLSAHLPVGRDVYTFCMCPGGTVIGAVSEAERLAVNGMSSNARDSVNANSAILVSVTPDDFPGRSPLGGIEFQRGLESRAFAMGGGTYAAPVQLSEDFIRGRVSAALGAVTPSYKPGILLADLNDLFPPELADSLKAAIILFDKKLRGFAMPDAALTAVESGSSSPVRILRDATYQSNIRGLFPCGEGAGYAGGIMSAAVDGIKCAEAILTYGQNDGMII
ncbi:MAG: hypothetical protein LBS84_05895 [Clostridiales bacterium]|jgi:uncharacterized FAD-dependent dehydrogenase|nr:hypothetical protein [Clostridiales bacterium]